METVVIRYDFYLANKAGIKIHPMKHVKEDLGMLIHDFEGVPIGDCVFMKVENVPEELPEYITISDHKMSR